ncbi:SPFH domain-containing protein [Glycomyces tenuis]|uniref:SPFH domain-containing protein n=1 Tax=Glycomyces tenuis TaxID=58116 RepID=UPI0003FCA564|nr:SPFH domain-containing protein [Glycomyces tenuis]
MFSRLRGDFVDIVERPEEALGARVWRFPRYDNEIKTGARLIVRECEAAVLVAEGRVADVFGPGAHTLEPDRLPRLSSLQDWPRGRNAPFRAEVYFVASGPFADLEWAAPEPVRVHDPEFGRLGVHAAGVCEARVANAARLLRESAAAEEADPAEALGAWLRGRIGAAFAAAAASADVSARDMAAGCGALGELLRGTVARQLASAGLDVVSFTVAELTLPPEVEAALEERAAKGSIGDAYTETGSREAGGHRAGRPSAEWYLGLDGHQVGPFGEEELRERAASGELTPQTLVRRSGREEWSAAGELPELADVVDSAPR